MITVEPFNLPESLRHEMKKARQLEWITIGYLASVVVIMYSVVGNSQAMKTAWLEDVLSLVPALAFLIASKFYNRPPTENFPYGYHRIYTIAFNVGALALLAMGLFLVIDSSLVLLKAEHPTIGMTTIFGKDIWMGWLMIGALLYSSIPAFFIGRKKHPYATALNSKVLFTDAEAQRADYQTALAAIAGIIGIGFGWWWADSVAALIISISIVYDGYINMRDAITDLMDRYPKKVEKEENSPLVEKIANTLRALPWVKEADVRVRENGLLFYGEAYVVPKSEQNLIANIEQAYTNLKNVDWKIQCIVITPVNQLLGK